MSNLNIDRTLRFLNDNNILGCEWTKQTIPKEKFELVLVHNNTLVDSLTLISNKNIIDTTMNAFSQLMFVVDEKESAINTRGVSLSNYKIVGNTIQIIKPNTISANDLNHLPLINYNLTLEEQEKISMFIEEELSNSFKEFFGTYKHELITIFNRIEDRETFSDYVKKIVDINEQFNKF